MSISLSEQTAVVTGASRGIGRAIAERLAEAGAHVTVHGYRHPDDAHRVAESIRRAGGSADVQLADLADVQQSTEFVERCWSTRAVDIWINNAGADVLTGLIARESFESKLERLWQVDVVGTIRVSRNVGQRMLNRGGVILNMGWDQAETGMAGESGEMFAATKGAIMSFTRSLAKSLAPNVRVNCLAPGWIQTQWGQQADDYWQERAEREALRGRWGTTDDVAQAALFLASSHADFITGQILHVNGGQAGFPAAPTENSNPKSPQV